MYQDGRRLPAINLKDVARAAGVHYSTASRALDPSKRSLVNAQTAAHVQEVAERLGYRQHLLASSLRRGRTNTIGMIVPDLDNPAWTPVLHGVTSALDDSGYLLLIGETMEDQRRYRRILQRLLDWRVDAVISAATRFSDLAWVREFARNAVPLLLAIRTMPTDEFVNIGEDSVRGGALAAEHLVSLGHRVLGQLEGPRDVPIFHDRSRGFVEQAARDGALVIRSKSSGKSATYEEGVRLAEQLLQGPGDPPTGIFAHNDQMAIGALDVLGRRGLSCPGDVSVIGYNDSPLADHVSPPLSTIRLPTSRVGALAGESAIKLIERSEIRPPSAWLPPELVVRRSTGPRRAHPPPSPRKAAG